MSSIIVIFHYKSRRVATVRLKTYAEVEESARRMFGIPEQQALSIQALFDGELAEIDPRLFPLISDSIDKYWISPDPPLTEEDGNGPIYTNTSIAARSPQTSPCAVKSLPPPRQERITLYFKSHRRDSKAIAFNVNPDLPFSSTFRALASQNQDALTMHYILIRNGETIDSEATPRSLGVKKGETIVFQPDIVVRKPVIYLFPPHGLEASVQLSLSNEWRFSTLYPVAPTKTIGNTEQVEWQVSVHPDGSMRDKNTGVDVAYLFWEANVKSDSLDTPPSSRPASPLAAHKTSFSPRNATIGPCDSVLLKIESVPAYLDQTLLALGLHTEARTSFITYWLPDMQKHKNVALRFLDQESYSAAAPLEVTPIPDIVARVFMLFRGVQDEELLSWDTAAYRAPGGWNDVVGISHVGSLRNARLFRVLEWGGLEVGS